MTTVGSASAHGSPSCSPIRGCGRALLAAAATMTLLDAALLQKSRSFFTGGFLAPIHTEGASGAALFLGVSLLADVGLLAVSGALAWSLAAPLRLKPRARMLAIFGGALVPLLLADVATYRLLAYLGDAFDFDLMFELSGRRPSELFAVGSSQILSFLALGAAAMVALAIGVLLLNRLGRGEPVTASRGGGVVVRRAVALALLGMAATATAAIGSETIADGLRRKPSGRFFTTIVTTASDFDRDGFGLLGPMPDVKLFDARIYPWAVDLPGNGIDENGVGGDLPAGLPVYTEGPSAPPAWNLRPDVVLVVLESFRADAVGMILNGQPVTPTLDALAREGISSSRAYSHNGYTAQSRFHLMTGSLSGLRGRTSLIDDFAANGYEVAYFSAQDESFGGPAFDVGFDRAHVRYDARQDRERRYSTFSTPGSLAVSAATLEERIRAYLAGRDRGRPLFLYVNFHDTHFPYHHDGIESIVSNVVVHRGGIAPSRRDDLLAMYYNTAANVDRAVGRVLDATGEALGRAPAVVVTGDHGESLFDEGFLGHGYALNTVQTRVPLVVRGLPLVIREPFGQVQLRDALSEALGAGSISVKPRIETPTAQTVLQYLGTIERPRQVGYVERSAYDFRTRAVVPLGRTRPADSADSDSDAQAIAGAVRTWERMRWAREGH